MKKRLGSLLALILLFATAFSQNKDDKDYIQNPTLGVHFLFHDFKTAIDIRNTSLKDVLEHRRFGKVKEMSPGLAINYIDGWTKHFDFTATLAGSFLDYPKRDGTSFGQDNLLLEGDVSIRGKMLSNKYWLSPYLQIGAGISMYKGTWGAFIPAGVGLQVNFFDEAYLLINSQYRMAVTESVNYHFFHSVGLAGNIGTRKKVTKEIPPPPLPPPPVDKDGDGIVDSVDACPDVKGLAAFNGCPDTDSDGIADKDDKCPTTRGIARYQGCPIPDTDNDGINDEDDKCPNEKGVGRYQGCPIPDRDKDGVNDEEDKCIDLPGTVANNGCPEIKEEVRKRIEVAARNIFFVTGSYRLLAKSNKSLDDVAKLMQEDTNLKLDIEGHTDNTGTAEKNQSLSDNRAKSVYDYLIKKGIAAERLKSAGYGQDQPVADNKTAAGRSQNRRVELKLHYN